MRALLLTVLAFGPATAWANTLTVGAGQTYGTISEAMAAAVDGDVLKLAAGVHRVDTTVAVTHDVSIEGGAGVEIASTLVNTAMFTLSSHTLSVSALRIRPDRAFVFTVGGTTAHLTLTQVDVTGSGATVSRDGVLLKITSGSADLSGGTIEALRAGGALSAGAAISMGIGAHVTVDGVTFHGNLADYGGSIYVESSSLTVTNSVFEQGTAARMGGAIFGQQLGSTHAMVLTGNTFDTNTANTGGAIYLSTIDTFTFTGNTFVDNRAINLGVSSQPQGGAIYLLSAATTSNPRKIDGNDFFNNDADYAGAAIRVYSSGQVSILQNKMCGGDTQYGGAISSYNSPILIADNVFDDNDATQEGGGLHCSGTPSGMSVYQNAFLGNGSPLGGQIYLGTCAPTVRNNLFMAGTGSTSLHGTTASEDYNAWWSNAGSVYSGITRGSHAVNSDPKLVRWTDDGNCTNDDIRPAYGSPLKNAGYPYTYDLDGTRSDIGPWGGPYGAPWMWADGDVDGAPYVYDCAPADDTVFPNAPETCDTRDEDCDGRVDLPLPTSAPRWYNDADGDGVGASVGSTTACTAPAGWVATGGDCKDNDATVFPGAGERCDGHDNDCDGLVDLDDDPAEFPTWYVDADRDGFGAVGNSRQSCEPVQDRVDRAGDCDDGDASRNPEMAEWCDGVDQDCDGTPDNDPIDPTDFYVDADHDGFGSLLSGVVTACSAPAGYVDGDLDCDDHDADVFPFAPESCVGAEVDSNCDGLAGTTDHDGDGAPACSDCNDANSQMFPGAPDTPYDGLIQDCDSTSDFDADRDGHDALAQGGDDCVDENASVHPGAAELPGDLLDNDCAGGDAPALPEDTGVEVLGPTCGGCDATGHSLGPWALGALVFLRRRRKSAGGSDADRSNG